MPNRFTAVPTGPVPRLRPGLTPVLVVADLFMAVMLSRPGGLSLRTAWVTSGTAVLVALVTPIAAVLAALLLIRGGWPSTMSAMALIVVCIGSAAVGMVAVAQRRG